MTKVTLLGDSIRLIGYGQRTAELLGEDFIVWQPEENCRFAQYTLRMLRDYAADIEGSDIIHWNNGLWDTCELYGDGNFTPPDRYVELMLRLATLLKQRAKTVIFATTTPVRDANENNDNETIARYNALLVPRLQEMGIVINDLNALLIDDVDTYIREDDLIHLTDAGIERCAAQAATVIRAEAAKL